VRRRKSARARALFMEQSAWSRSIHALAVMKRHKPKAYKDLIQPLTDLYWTCLPVMRFDRLREKGERK